MGAGPGVLELLGGCTPCGRPRRSRRRGQLGPRVARQTSRTMADPTIDEIKQRIDIIDLISGTVQLKKAGRSFKGLCPFHQEKTPSFNVDPDRGTFHCFGCSKSGDVFTWLQETEGLDFGEALRRLADRAGVRLPERQAPRADPAAQAAKD